MITNISKILNKNNKKDGQYSLYGRISIGKATVFGFQHVLAMFVGNLTPILIVGGLCGLANEGVMSGIIQSAMLIAGIVTLIQAITIGPVGAGLPCVMGTASCFISVMTSVIEIFGGGIIAYGAILAASFIGGFFATILGVFLKPLRKLFPPIVTGIALVVIGFSLIEVGAKSFAGGSGSADFGNPVNLIVALFVFSVILICKHSNKDFLSNSSILIGIILGYILCAILPIFISPTFVSSEGGEQLHSWVLQWDTVWDTAWFSIPQLFPVEFVFDFRAIIPISFMFIVTTIETVGNLSGIAEIAHEREATSRELSGGVMCEGLGSSLASLFGVLPTNSFGQNVGIISLTKIVNLFSICCGSIILMISGFLPKIAAVFNIMPQPVLGGAAILMFSSIIVVGIKMVTKEQIDARAVTIISASLGLGFGLTCLAGAIDGAPDLLNVFLSSSILKTIVVAIFLNLILPKERKSKKKN